MGLKILVTGSDGFIARHLINKLNEMENVSQVYCVNRNSGASPETAAKSLLKLVDVYANLAVDASVESFFKSVKPDIIFHLAASQAKTPEGYENNVKITLNLLRYCAEGTRFVYASSSTVYGNLAIHLRSFDESNQEIFEGWFNQRLKCEESQQTEVTSLYGASKLAGEGLVHSYDKIGHVNGVILRLVATVGNGATHGIVPTIIHGLKSDRISLEFWGDEPGSIKPYMHVSDVVDALIHFGFGDYDWIYNISVDDEISIKEVAETICEKIDNINNKDKIWEWKGESLLHPGDNKLAALDNTNTRLSGGWEPKIKTSKEAVAKATEEILS